MKKFDKVIKRVQNPSRYIGGEINSYKKDLTDETVRFAFAFPDIYEIGMSHLGLRILYNLLNEQENIYCERVFTPWEDFEREMKKVDLELCTLETKTPLKAMDFVGFTLQYELSYTNILKMLDLANIPFKSKDRTEEDPLVIAGGPTAYNPEPLAEIIDLFVIGEGEEVTLELLELYKKYKNKLNKDEFLKEAVKIDGIYVPKFYEVLYHDDGTIKAFKNEPFAPEKIQKRIIENFDEAYYPDQFIVPFQDVVHDRVMVEVFRGCTQGCRFCQAGMIYRPVRERKKETINEIISKLIKNTGYEEIALSSLSTLDHSEIKDIILDNIKKYEDDKVGLALPSLRLDTFAIDLLKEIQKIRKTGLTFAPEAGTQRLRDTINKGVSEENLVKTLEEVFSNGWSRVKLYFMLGLPTETYEDIDGIAALANKAVEVYKSIPKDQTKGRLYVTISTSNFVPKPFTPYQWHPQDSIEASTKKHDYLNNQMNSRYITYNYHDSYTSYVEGVFSRGDRKLNDALIKAYTLGCKFDGWKDHFDFEKWMEAFDATDIDPAFYVTRERAYDEILPWDFIDIGVRKQYLIDENEKSKDGITTQDCRNGCTGCGINIDLIGGDCECLK